MQSKEKSYKVVGYTPDYNSGVLKSTLEIDGKVIYHESAFGFICGYMQPSSQAGVVLSLQTESGSMSIPFSDSGFIGELLLNIQLNREANLPAEPYEMLLNESIISSLKTSLQQWKR